MDRPSYYAPSSSSSPPTPSSARPNKVITQREYRSKEGECFTKLKDIIQKLTGEELQTRHEILTKVIMLLEATRLAETKVNHMRPPYDTHSPFDSSNATSNNIDYSLQSSLPSQFWHPAIQPDTQTAHYFHQFPDQVGYPIVSSANPPLNQGQYVEARHNLFY